MVSTLIQKIYAEWEARSEGNNPSKLAKKMGSTCQSVRNMINGVVKKPSFYLFDKFLRATGTTQEDYIQYTKEFYPDFVDVAKRFLNSFEVTNDDDSAWMLNSALAQKIYQKVITNEPMSREKISKLYGEEGVRVLDKLHGTEKVVIKENGSVEAIAGIETQLDGHFGVELMKKNVSKCGCERAGQDGTRAICMQLYMPPEHANTVRERLVRFCQDAWDELKALTFDQGETFTVNIAMLPVDEN